MRKKITNWVMVALAVFALTFYTYLGYRLGHSAGKNAGWHEALVSQDLPSRSEIMNMAAACR